MLTLPTNDIIYDSLTRLIYASVPSRAGAKGNSIVPIDPVRARIGPAVFVGSEPNKLALSDDGRLLYVGLEGSASIRAFHAIALSAGPEFVLGSDPFFGPYYAEDIEVLPGSPQSVAVSRKYAGVSPRHAGVAVYDRGVQRPTATPGHTGSNVIEFSASASTLYGYNNETTDFGFRTMLVDATGVSITNTAFGLISGFSVDMEFDTANGWIYATSGAVVDPLVPRLVGTIAASGPVEPDSANGIVFYLTGSAPTLTLQVFDATTFVPVNSLPITGVSGTAGSLIRWGARGLAFRTTGDQVFLIRPGAP